MKTNLIGYWMVSAIALILAARDIHALTFTKDTVYESVFSETDPSWAIWNDSTSRENNPPGGRVPITGFQMSNCIECPLARGAAAGNDMDTLTTYVIFDSKVEKDTLVVIGDIRKGTTGIRIPLRPREMKRGGIGSGNFRFFDFLGRIRFLNRPTPG